jgi:flagellar brake protein
MMADAEPTEDFFSEEESQFLVHSEAEVAYILSKAQEKTALVTVYFNAGRDFAITSILAIHPEADEMIFDAPARAELVDRLIESRRIVFVTVQDGIRIKFVVGSAWRATFEERPALGAEIPRSLVRLQRREYFRVSCPIGNPVRCTIPISKQANGPAEDVVVTLVDISLGGAAISDNHHINAAPGAIYRKCRIHLPDGGIVTTDLEVRNSYLTQMKNGTTVTRLGCAFINLAPAGSTTLQRFIMKLERDRNNRFAGA